MKLKSILLVLTVFFSFSLFGQADETWKNVVKSWESSKSDLPTYCVFVTAASAKGYASDFNSAEGSQEGHYLAQDSGFFKINVVKFMNKGEVYELDAPAPAKEKHKGLSIIKENLIFAEENQQYLKITKNEADNGIDEYKVEADMPVYGKFTVNVYVNSKTKQLQKSMSVTSGSSDYAEAEGRFTVNYVTENGKLHAKEYIEDGKIEFFGNVTYISEKFTFSY